MLAAGSWSEIGMYIISYIYIFFSISLNKIKWYNICKYHIGISFYSGSATKNSFKRSLQKGIVFCPFVRLPSHWLKIITVFHRRYIFKWFVSPLSCSFSGVYIYIPRPSAWDSNFRPDWRIQVRQNMAKSSKVCLKMIWKALKKSPKGNHPVNSHHPNQLHHLPKFDMFFRIPGFQSLKKNQKIKTPCGALIARNPHWRFKDVRGRRDKTMAKNWVGVHTKSVHPG